MLFYTTESKALYILGPFENPNTSLLCASYSLQGTPWLSEQLANRD